jgi:hypothetical protein
MGLSVLMITLLPFVTIIVGLIGNVSALLLTEFAIHFPLMKASLFRLVNYFYNIIIIGRSQSRSRPKAWGDGWGFQSGK